MNDPHPSGNSIPADNSPDFSYSAYGAGYYEQAAFDSYVQPAAQQGYPTAYDGYSTGTFDNLAVSYGDGDPLFGAMPGSVTAPGTDTGSYATGGYDAYAGYGTYAPTTYDTGTYDTGSMWANSGYAQAGHIPAQPGAGQGADGGYATGQWPAGQWDTGQWGAPADSGSWGTVDNTAGALGQGTNQYAAPHYDGYASPYEYEYEYDVPAQGYEGYESYQPQEGYGVYEQPQPSYDYAYDEQFAQEAAPDATTAFAGESHFDPDPDPDPHIDLASEVVPVVDAAPYRGRRRPAKPRRSALLTVAVPSVAVMGVAAAAAASVMGTAPESDSTTTQAAADAPGVKPANSKLDTQLAGVSADADDFADRASRTQERLDLKQRQEEEQARKEKAAARKEALRPKFALPAKQRGLSARFGQAGINWMSVHTGIDFPLSYGTPVMAATDGTISTKYDMSFGNMAIVTAPDGTETWYCHLSSTKIRSGHVKAGDTIAYSGNSGNTTGPHLHFEVHPGGGEAVDPLPWLRSKGLDPT